MGHLRLSVDTGSYVTLMNNRSSRSRRIAAAMDDMWPLFDKTKTDRYRLARVKRRDQSRVADAIALATGKEVKRIEFVSLSKPPLKPDGMSQEAYETGVWHSLRDGLATTLKECLDARFKNGTEGINVDSPNMHSFSHRLHACLLECLSVIFMDSLQEDLWPELRGGCCTGFRDDVCCYLRVNLYFGLRDSVYYHDFFALAGHWKDVRRLSPLVRLIPDFLPLGEKKDEPGTWLVFAA